MAIHSTTGSEELSSLLKKSRRRRRKKMSTYAEHDGCHPPLSLLEPPATTDFHRSLMDEFIKSPSPDRWTELVEMMRREREEQLIEFYKANNGGSLSLEDAMRLSGAMAGDVDSSPPSPSCSNGGSPVGSPRRGRSPNSPRGVHQDNNLDGDIFDVMDNHKPDPPSYPEIYDDDAMGGWTMHARSKKISGEHEDDKVSEQLKYILSQSILRSDEITDDRDEEDGIEQTLYPKQSSYANRMLSPKSTICIFLSGFLIGIMVIVALSLSFGRSPSEEIRVVALRAHGSGQHIGDSRDGPEDTSNDRAEDEVDLDLFCGSCQWKHMPFSCRERVEWEMEKYGMPEEAATRANMIHCTEPATTSP